MFAAEPVDITLVSFGYDGFNAIKDAATTDAGNIQKGLLKAIGSSRTLDRVENIYQVKGGKPVFVQ